MTDQWGKKKRPASTANTEGTCLPVVNIGKALYLTSMVPVKGIVLFKFCFLRQLFFLFGSLL